MIRKCMKKPIAVECVQWDGLNYEEIEKFTGGKCMSIDYNLYIQTLEGDMLALKNSYIIKGVDGEFYPCKEEIFEKTYEFLE